MAQPPSTQESGLFELSPKKSLKFKISLGVAFAILVGMADVGGRLLSKYIDVRDEIRDALKEFRLYFPVDEKGRPWEFGHGLPIGHQDMERREREEQSEHKAMENRCKDEAIRQAQSADLHRRHP